MWLWMSGKFIPFHLPGRESRKKGEQTRFHLVILIEWDKYIFRAIRPSGHNLPPGAVFIQGNFHGRSTRHAIRRTG